MPDPLSETLTLIVSIACRGNAKLAGWRFCHRLDRVAHQIENHLLDLHSINQDNRVLTKLKVNHNLGLSRGNKGEIARIHDRCGNRNVLPFRLALRHKGSKMTDDFSRTLGLLIGLCKSRRAEVRLSIGMGSRRLSAR